MEKQQQTVKLVNGGHANHQQYMRFEIPKVSRVNDTYAITLYQIDYNNIAEKIESGLTVSTLDVKEGEVIPVAKLATSRQGLENLKKAIDEILEKSKVAL